MNIPPIQFMNPVLDKTEKKMKTFQNGNMSIFCCEYSYAWTHAVENAIYQAHLAQTSVLYCVFRSKSTHSGTIKQEFI